MLAEAMRVPIEMSIAIIPRKNRSEMYVQLWRTHISDRTSQ